MSVFGLLIPIWIFQLYFYGAVGLYSFYLINNIIILCLYSASDDTAKMLLCHWLAAPLAIAGFIFVIIVQLLKFTPLVILWPIWLLCMIFIKDEGLLLATSTCIASRKTLDDIIEKMQPKKEKKS